MTSFVAKQIRAQNRVSEAAACKSRQNLPTLLLLDNRPTENDMRTDSCPGPGYPVLDRQLLFLDYGRMALLLLSQQVQSNFGQALCHVQGFRSPVKRRLYLT